MDLQFRGTNVTDSHCKSGCLHLQRLITTRGLAPNSVRFQTRKATGFPRFCYHLEEPCGTAPTRAIAVTKNKDLLCSGTAFHERVKQQETGMISMGTTGCFNSRTMEQTDLTQDNLEGGLPGPLQTQLNDKVQTQPSEQKGGVNLTPKRLRGKFKSCRRLLSGAGEGSCGLGTSLFDQ